MFLLEACDWLKCRELDLSANDVGDSKTVPKSERSKSSVNLLKDWKFEDLGLRYNHSESEFDRERWWLSWTQFTDLYDSISNIIDVWTYSLHSGSSSKMWSSNSELSYDVNKSISIMSDVSE